MVGAGSECHGRRTSEGLVAQVARTRHRPAVGAAAHAGRDTAAALAAGERTRRHVAAGPSPPSEALTRRSDESSTASSSGLNRRRRRMSRGRSRWTRTPENCSRCRPIRKRLAPADGGAAAMAEQLLDERQAAVGAAPSVAAAHDASAGRQASPVARAAVGAARRHAVAPAPASEAAADARARRRHAAGESRIVSRALGLGAAAAFHPGWHSHTPPTAGAAPPAPRATRRR